MERLIPATKPHLEHSAPSSHFAASRAWLSNLTDGDVRTIANHIDATGYYCVPAFLSHDDVEHISKFVAKSIAAAGNETVTLDRRHLSGSWLDELADLPDFKDLFCRICREGYRQTPPDADLSPTLRCLTGVSQTRHSLLFHYDSYLLTGVIPIVIPGTGQRGDLLMIPNARKPRRSYVFNVADKILLDNPLTQVVLRALAPERLTRVSMVVGNLYLFSGYRSIHANDPVETGAVRATAIFHYADPHENSPLKRWLGRTHRGY